MSTAQPPAAKLDAAIVVSGAWRARPELTAFADLLDRAGIAVMVVGTLDEALAALRAPGGRTQCLILDAAGLADAAIGGAIRRLRQAQPAVAPIVAATAPSVELVAGAFRAGAADVIDLAPTDDLAVLGALDAAARDHLARAHRHTRIDELRKLIDDFLRVLVKAERRTLELEAALHPEEDAATERDPGPQLLIVDDDAGIVETLLDVLTPTGLGIHAAYTGEEAIETIERMAAARRHIDLALVDKNLPGMDGLETIRQLRARIAGLPCMLITGYSSSDSAVRAADLGVVGYVLKPFDDVRELSTRVKDLAERYAAERRERRYLARIKQKHAQFLGRYSLLVAELDRLKE